MRPRKAGWALALAFLVGAGWFGAGLLLNRSSGSATGSGPTRGADAAVDLTGFMSGACDMSPQWATYLYRGWDGGAVRDWDIAAVPEEKNWFGSFQTTSHSGPFSYLQEVPLVFYGPGFIRSQESIDLEREVGLADVPVTQARLLHLARFNREGNVLEETLKVGRPRPALIVTLVIDGGGWNVLEEMPGTWPNLATLLDRGTSFEGAVVGSSPSITPAAHTTLSTGSWPDDHGVMAIVARADDGSIVGGFARDPSLSGASAADPTVTLDTTTLADEWDLATNNKAKVAMIASQNFHLGMIGHGASIQGADKDIAAMTDGHSWATNRTYFALPRYANTDVEGPRGDLQDVDLADGEVDARWRGHGFFRIDATPAYAPWETRLLKTIVRREGFGQDAVTDLFYINYKAPDAAGHKWNMTAPEQRDVIRSVDEAVGQVVQFLDQEVGPRNYVLTITADHGQTPLGTGGWPINQVEVKRDLEARFDRVADGRGIVETTSTAIYFMNREEMQSSEVSPEDVATFLSRYTVGDNIPDGAATPEGYEGRLDEEVFAALIPGRQMDRVAECTGAQAGRD